MVGGGAARRRFYAVCVVVRAALGNALASYKGFAGRGFHVAAAFDADPDKIGHEMPGGLLIEDVANLEARVQAAGWKIGIIAVPADAAQSVANTLVGAGVIALLNYAPISLIAPSSVRVEQIDPAVHLQHLTYYLG